MSDDTATLILALATENTELRAQLAEAQDLLVETAVDAGELHAEVETLRVQVAALQSNDRNASGRCHNLGASVAGKIHHTEGVGVILMADRAI